MRALGSCWTCLGMALLMLAVSGCGTKRFETRFTRAMKVLDHEAQKRAAVGLHWADEDWVSCDLPKQLRVKLERGEWPELPYFLPGQDVLAVYAGELPAEGEQQPGEPAPLLRCYLLAEKAEPVDGATPATSNQSQEPATLGLHQRVKDAWEQAFSRFEPEAITLPRGNEFGADEYGSPRRFDRLHPQAEDNPRQPEEDVYLFLFPSAVDDRSQQQLAIYFHILDGPAHQTELLRDIELSLETLNAGIRQASGGGAVPIGF